MSTKKDQFDLFSPRRMFAEGKGRTKADRVVFNGVGRGALLKKDNSPTEKIGKKRSNKDMEHDYETEDLTLTDREKSYQEKKNKELISRQKEEIFKKAIQDNKESLLVLEKFFNRKGDPRKRNISLDISNENVERDLNKLRQDGREKRISDIKEYLQERNVQVDEVSKLEYKKNKEIKIKLLEREIKYLEKDIHDLEKQGKDPSVLVRKLEEKTESLSRLKGFAREKNQPNNVTLKEALINLTEAENNPSLENARRGQKTRHWPPEDFVQKPGVVRRWPAPVDNRYGETKDQIKRVNLVSALDNATADNASESLDQYQREINILDEQLLDAEKYMQTAKRDGDEKGAYLYQQEVERIKKVLWKKLNQKPSAGTEQSIKSDAKETLNPTPYSIETEDLPGANDPFTIKNETIKLENGDFVYENKKEKTTVKEAVSKLERSVGPDFGPQDIDEAIAGSERVIKAFSDLNTPFALKIIEEQKERIKNFESLKYKNTESSAAENVILSGDDKNSVESILSTKVEQKDLPKIKFSGLFEDAEKELSKNGWTKEEFEALSEEEKHYVFWHGIKEENYSRNKDKEVISDVKENTYEQFGDKEILSFAETLFKRRGVDGRVDLTEEEVNFYNNKKEQVDKALADLVNKENTIKPLPKATEDFIKAEKEARKNESTSKIPENISVKPEVMDKLIGLGINSLESMYAISPEFFSLSPEKQIYLISKLEQKIYLDAEFSAKDKNEEEISKMGWFKKIGASFNKDKRKVELRDKIIDRVKSSGLDGYHSDVSVIADYLKAAPNLIYKKSEGEKIVPHFEYVEKNPSDDKELQVVKEFFNSAASRFGEIPFEWSLKDATSFQKEAYKKAKSSYESAKNALSKEMLFDIQKRHTLENKFSGGLNEEKYKKEQVDSMIAIRKADASVNFGRYITQNPDMENLASSNAFERFMGTKVGDFFRAKAFFAVGYGIKAVGRFTGVGLVASAAVGGYMGFRKKGLEFSEKELRKRYGKSAIDVSNLDIQIDEKTKEIQKIQQLDDLTVIQKNKKIENISNEISILAKQRRELLIKSGVKENINSENVYSRLEKLLDQFEKTEDLKSQKRIIETIKTRLFVTDQMMQDGRINFGKPKDQIKNQFKMSDLISRATILVEMNGGFGEKKTEEEVVFEKFKQFIEDDATQKKKNKAKLLAGLKGAGIGAVGFGAGAAVRWAQENGYFDWVYGAWGGSSSSLVTSVENAKDSAGASSIDPELESSSSVKPKIAEYEKYESVDVGSRGMIGGIQDLQRLLSAKFTGGEIPSQYREFLRKDAHDIAREWGVYRPGEENESAKVFKGAKFEIGKNGEVRFINHVGAMQKVFAPEAGISQDFEGEFFNANDAKNLVEDYSQTYSESYSSDQSNLNRFIESEEGGESSVVRKDFKPGQDSWYEKPVPERSGYSPVRGSYEVLRDANGNLTGLDTRKTISDEVIKFRQNPRNFLVEDLAKTDLLAKTDSFAVKTLTENRNLIEPYIIERNILNDSTATALTEADRVELAKKLEVMAREINAKTGGAFDTKPEDIKVGGVKPGRVTFFDTDAPVIPKVNPSTQSVLESSDARPSPKVNTSLESGLNISGKSYEISFGEMGGKKFIPVSVESSWNMDDTPSARSDAMKRIINPEYHQVLRFNQDFDRLAVAQGFLDSGKYPIGSEENEALQNYVTNQKKKIAERLRAPNVFEVGSPKISLGGREFVMTSGTLADVNSGVLRDVAKRYITDGNLRYNGNLIALGPDHVGVYEESTDQAQALRKLNLFQSKNVDKLGAVAEEKLITSSDGKYKILRVYKLKK